MKLGVPLSYILALIVSLASYMFGGWSSLLSILTFMIIVDYITGVIAAGIEGKISSRLGFKGIAQKIIIFALVAVSHMLDLVIGEQHMIRDATVFFYIMNECVSIIENAGRTGLPIPNFLLKTIDILKNKSKQK